MAIEKVREYFSGLGMADRILEFDVSSATVELAAQALNCVPCRIAKTLSFMAGEQPVLIVAAGDAKVDNAKYKAEFGKKAKMLTPDEVVQLIGHAVERKASGGDADAIASDSVAHAAVVCQIAAEVIKAARNIVQMSVLIRNEDGGDDSTVINYADGSTARVVHGVLRDSLPVGKLTEGFG